MQRVRDWNAQSDWDIWTTTLLPGSGITVRESAERLSEPEVVGFSRHNRAVTHMNLLWPQCTQDLCKFEPHKFQHGVKRQRNMKSHPER